LLGTGDVEDSVPPIRAVTGTTPQPEVTIAEAGDRTAPLPGPRRRGADVVATRPAPGRTSPLSSRRTRSGWVGHGERRSELLPAPARRAAVTPSERDALLSELHAYGGQQVTGAQAILDEVELGTRVAQSLAQGSAA